MPQERRIRRYSPFFEGWAQALGNHRGGLDESQARNWLFGDDQDQLGLILTPQVLAGPFQALSTQVGGDYQLSLGPEQIGVPPHWVPLEPCDQEAVTYLRWLLDAPGDLYLYQTYHLFYPQGTRILTLSRKAPLAIIYKETDSILVRVL